MLMMIIPSILISLLTNVIMISRLSLSHWLFVCTCVAQTALLSIVIGASNISTDKFRCSQVCISQSTLSAPMSYDAASRIQCAAECSKRSWCNSYMFEKVKDTQTFNLQLPSKPCRLYVDAAVHCSATQTATLLNGICVKLKPLDPAVSQPPCSISSDRVLEVVNSSPYAPQGQEYLRTVLTSGNRVEVQFSKGTSKFTAKVAYYMLAPGILGIMCASVLDHLSASTFIATTSSRCFCANGSQIVSPVKSGYAEQFYWNMENLHVTADQGRQKVYAKGESVSNLLSAVNNGLDITLLFTTDNKVAHADILIHNVNTNGITTQTRTFENGEESVISHATDGTTVTLSWPTGAPNLAYQYSKTSQSVWLADTCWKFICTTSATSMNPNPNLKASFESGRRIRITITIDDQNILATPEFMESDMSGRITTHVLRVLLEETPTSSGGLVGGLVNGLLGAQTQTQTQSSWAHFVVSSNGTLVTFSTQLGLQECKYTSRAVRVDWFEQIQNWTRVHVSSLGNVATLPLLAEKVLRGSDVRVKIEVGGTVSWYSCDMVEVVNNGDDVKCHVSGKLAVTTSDSKDTSLLGGLLSSGSTATCSIRSECFIISASLGTIGSISSCLWKSSTLPYYDTRSNKLISWFVL